MLSSVAFRGFVAVALLLGLGLIPTGCGLARQPDVTGARYATGVAPWQDQGPLDMCIGPHRVGPPGTDLGGFCVPKGTVAALPTCGSDADCNSREYCVCGHCMVKYCTGNDECGPDGRCDFSANRCIQPCRTDCDCDGPNARCDIGMCQQMCLVNAECQTGEICSLSRARCMTVPCRSDADCFEDEECMVQREPRHVSSPSVLPGRDGFKIFLAMDHYGQERIYGGEGNLEGVNLVAHSLLAPPDCQQQSNCIDYHDPTVIDLGGRYVMYYVKTRFYYDSANPAECGNTICELGEDRIPGCWTDCPTLGIFRAESDDGLDWTDSDEPVLVPYYDWEEGRVASPNALVDLDGRIRLYYEAGFGRAIALAVSLDAEGRDFGDPSGDPASATEGVRRVVLTPDALSSPEFWRDVSLVRRPRVLLDEDFEGRLFYRMWVSAFGEESGEGSSFGQVEQIPANYSIGYAGSQDGIHWEVWPYNPVFDRVVPNSFLNHASEVGALVFHWGTGYVLLYESTDREETSWDNVGFAVNPPQLPR